MEIVGQCPGEKRKLGQLAHAPPSSNAGDIIGDEASSVTGTHEEQPEPLIANAEVEPQPLQASAPAASHEGLRRQLMARNVSTRSPGKPGCW